MEITSSGLTHTCNRNALGICAHAMRGNTPMTYQASQMIVDLNYGIFEINLPTDYISDAVLTLQIKGRGNQTFFYKDFPLSLL